jgi:uncharacterized membrane protein
VNTLGAVLRRAPLISVGRWFFGLALIGLGLEHFIFREFVTGRAPAWPNGLPGKMLWVSVSGAIVIVTGLAVLARRWGRPAALGLALLVFAWALLRHLPIVAADSLLGGTWTRAGKALTIVGGLFAVAATLPPIVGKTSTSWRRFANATGPFVLAGQISLACFLIIAGLQHFLFTQFVVTLIPSWVPGNATWWAWFAGVALLAGGVGLLVPRTAAAAGLMSGLMIFSWFWIVHLPRVRTTVSDGIAVFEALAFSGIALVIAGALAGSNSRTGSPSRRGTTRGGTAVESSDRIVASAGQSANVRDGQIHLTLPLAAARPPARPGDAFHQVEPPGS